MELRSGSVGSQAVARRMDGDSRDGGGGKDATGSEDYENLPTSASVSTHMTAGAMAGILEHSVMYPVDSVKVRRWGTSGTQRAEEERARVCIPRADSLGAESRNRALPRTAAGRGIPGSSCAQPGRRAFRRPSEGARSLPRTARCSRCVPGPGCWRGRRSGEHRWLRRRLGSRGTRSLQLCTVLPRWPFGLAGAAHTCAVSEGAPRRGSPHHAGAEKRVALAGPRDPGLDVWLLLPGYFGDLGPARLLSTRGSSLPVRHRPVGSSL